MLAIKDSLFSVTNYYNVLSKSGSGEYQDLKNSHKQKNLRISNQNHSLNRGQSDSQNFSFDYKQKQLRGVPNSQESMSRSFLYADQETEKNEQQDWSEEKQKIVSLEQEYILKLTKMIRDHIKQNKNQLNQIYEYFIKQFTDNYESIEMGRYKLIKEEILVFCEVLLDTIISYYGIQPSYHFQNEVPQHYFNYDNLKTFVISHVLKNRSVNHIVFQQLYYEYQSDTKILKEQLANFYKYDNIGFITQLMQYLEINVKYRLDPSTSKYLENRYPNDVKYFEPDELPYQNAFIELRKIIKAKSVSSKLKIIFNSQEEIIKCINYYYVQCGIYFDCCLIGADELMPIYIYIIQMAGVFDINLNLQFCYDFSTEKQKDSLMGFYLVCYMTACNYLIQNQGKFNQIINEVTEQFELSSQNIIVNQ